MAVEREAMRYLIAAAVLGLAGSSFAETINVPSDHDTIQGAINASSDGDGLVGTNDILAVLSAWGPCP